MSSHTVAGNNSGQVPDSRSCPLLFERRKQQMRQERIVLVLGSTGSGKSTFTRAMLLEGNLTSKNVIAKENAGIKLPEVSSSVASCTKVPEAYSIPPIDGVPYKIWDFMGHQDTQKRDSLIVQQLATICEKLSDVVGIVYLFDGRVNSTEAKNCQFLIEHFFSEVSATNLLVVKTKCENWNTCNIDEEKKHLKDKIKGKILVANWIAVNFGQHTPLDDAKAMVNFVKEKFSRWKKPLKLSKKGKLACQFAPMYLKHETTILELLAKQAELEEMSKSSKAAKAELEKVRKDIKKKWHKLENSWFYYFFGCCLPSLQDLVEYQDTQ